MYGLILEVLRHFQHANSGYIMAKI